MLGHISFTQNCDISLIFPLISYMANFKNTFSYICLNPKKSQIVHTNQQKHQQIRFFFSRRIRHFQFFIGIQKSAKENNHAPRRRNVQF